MHWWDFLVGWLLLKNLRPLLHNNPAPAPTQKAFTKCIEKRKNKTVESPDGANQMSKDMRLNCCHFLQLESLPFLLLRSSILFGKFVCGFEHPLPHRTDPGHKWQKNQRSVNTHPEAHMWPHADSRMGSMWPPWRFCSNDQEILDIKARKIKLRQKRIFFCTFYEYGSVLLCPRHLQVAQRAQKEVPKEL